MINMVRVMVYIDKKYIRYTKMGRWWRVPEPKEKKGKEGEEKRKEREGENTRKKEKILTQHCDPVGNKKI